MTSNTDKIRGVAVSKFMERKLKTGWTNSIMHLGGVFNDAFKAGYQAREAEGGWVLFKDIPDEWRDGRLVDVFTESHGRVTDVYWRFEKWVDDSYGGGDFRPNENTVCYVRLPPTQPKENN